MTNDQFETLAQMIKGVHDDLSAEIGSLSSDLQSFKLETRENFAKVFAHLTSHDRDLSMIKKEMMDQGRTLKSLAGLEMEVIETKRRVTRIEQQRDIPRPALQ